ncbi:uncharacterized protein LOC110074663 isoform X3 [Pogona vitticeps]
MSNGTARKVQPFTISTKLSLPKCSLDFPEDSCPGIPIDTLDNRDLHQNLNKRVSLYLAQASPGLTGHRFNSTSPIEEEEVTHEDQINRNSLSRSIKKITLSSSHGESSSAGEGLLMGPTHISSDRNCNNNNCRTGKAQYKVFLKKEVGTEEEKQEVRTLQIASCTTTTPWKESVKNTQASRLVGVKRCIQSSTGLAELSRWSPVITQFNCDMVQAEKWVRGKLRDLKDGSNIQEWEREAQTLQRDMKDFENTVIKLNQMGEQLMIQPNPSTEIAKRLQTLGEQWQLLKQMAVNQNKAVGSLRNLQDFNQKAEQLEAWIKQKEEKPLLTTLLQENADKIQLTRRILDLKQEEQQFQALHEEINSLAHKLEKQGKSESRSIVARRKHLNKMWLQLQGTLKEHHETLQLSLEAAAFLQQADVLLAAIHAKWRSLCTTGKQREPEAVPDLDVRDIASQVMMLDVAVSQLTSLHPSLGARVSLKHQDVKESWAQLQELWRSEKPSLLPLTRRWIDSPGCEQEMTSTTNDPRPEAQERSAWQVQKDVLENMAECLGGQEGNSDSTVKEANSSGSRRHRRRKLLRQSNALKDVPQQKAHPQDVCQAADGLLDTGQRWSPQVEEAFEELEDLWAELKRRHQENGVALREIDMALRLVGELEEAECWLGTVTDLLSEPKAAKNLDGLRGELQKIGILANQAGTWSMKLQALQEEMQMEASSERTAAAMIQKKMERVKEKLGHVQDNLQQRSLGLHDSLILMEFLQNVQLEEMLNQKNQMQAVPNRHSSEESLHLLLAENAQQLSSEHMSRPLEELQEAVEMLNNVVKEQEWASEGTTQVESPQALTDGEETRLAWITSQMESLRDRAEAWAQDIIQAEQSFVTVKSEQDLLELKGLLEKQKEIESDMSDLSGDIEELERAVAQLEECCLLPMSDESRRILEILEAWKDLQKVVSGNAVHGHQAVQLRQFFRDYLAMISWTENTRAQIFSESLSAQHLTEAQWEDMENNMETKFQESEELAALGWELVTKEHYMREIIIERMEELRSMLGWVMVHLRAQSSQKDLGNKNDSPKTQDSTQMTQNCQIKVTPETTVPKAEGTLGSPGSEGPPLILGLVQNGSPAKHQDQEKKSVSTAILSVLDVFPLQKQSFKDSENSMPFETDIPKETLVLEPSETPVMLVPQPGPGSLGNTVNLILSIGKKEEKEATGSQARASLPMGQETLHKLPEIKSSACKTFWKRCQGFLGNTLSSLKRKKRPPRQHGKEVSTYLQVKEKEGDKHRCLPCGSSISMLQHAKRMPPGAHYSPIPSPEWGPAAFHTLPKTSSSCFLQSLKRKTKGKIRDVQLLTLQGIMETEQKDLQSGQKEKHSSTSSTWPPKYVRRTQGLGGPYSPPAGELMDYVKNPLMQIIDTECDSVGERTGQCIDLRRSQHFSGPQSLTEKMNTCQHLSLGSVLSLELPKDPTALRDVRDAIKVAKEGIAKRRGFSYPAQVSTSGTNIQEATLQKGIQGVVPVMPQGPIRAGDANAKRKGGASFDEVSFNQSHGMQKTFFVAAYGEDKQSPRSQSGSSDDFVDFKQNRLSRISALHEQIGWEWDKLAASLDSTGSSNGELAKNPADSKAKVKEASRVKLKPSPAEHTSNAGATSHTLRTGISVNESPEIESSKCSVENVIKFHPSSVHLGRKCPPKSSVLECELAPQKGIPAPSEIALTSEELRLQDVVKICHPAREVFEEEEEELQAIWSNVEKNKRSLSGHGDSEKNVEKVQGPAYSGGKPILASADNMLVAKFKLPFPAQVLQSLEGEKETSDGHPMKNSPNECWASVPSCQEPPERPEASPMSPLQSICPVDQQKLQEGSKNVGKVLPSKLELQMMEGTLERKHLLQPGGKKANCRSWNTFHTVLMRQTLCFYQDKKDTLKQSSAVALPLNLSGAVCALDKEYTKKNNCFTLQLKDGSKYLLRAPTEPLRKEWVIKLQQNSGLPEVDYFQSVSQTAQGMTSVVSVIPNHGASQFLGHHPAIPAKSQEAMVLPRSNVRLQLPYNTQSGPLDAAASGAGNVHRSAATYNTEQSLRHCSTTASPASQDRYISLEDDDCGLVTNKRRSYSFTSATYQKITPLSVSKESLGAGSSYSVTLYIGEQAAPTPRPRCHSFITTPRGIQETLGGRSQDDSIRQKNKSVFRKFFGKKD